MTVTIQSQNKAMPDNNINLGYIKANSLKSGRIKDLIKAY